MNEAVLANGLAEYSQTERDRVGRIRERTCNWRRRKTPRTFTGHSLMALHRLIKKNGLIHDVSASLKTCLSHWPSSAVINIVLCDYLGLGSQKMNKQSLTIQTV